MYKKNKFADFRRKIKQEQEKKQVYFCSQFRWMLEFVANANTTDESKSTWASNLFPLHTHYIFFKVIFIIRWNITFWHRWHNNLPCTLLYNMKQCRKYKFACSFGNIVANIKRKLLFNFDCNFLFVHEQIFSNSLLTVQIYVI